MVSTSRCEVMTLWKTWRRGFPVVLSRVRQINSRKSQKERGMPLRKAPIAADAQDVRITLSIDGAVADSAASATSRSMISASTHD